MKYIPVDKLIAEIERQQRKLTVLSLKGSVDVRRDSALQGGVYDYILSVIKSLQQEQPEVDLQKDIKTFTAEKLLLPITGNQREPMDITEGDWVACAYHFYELGNTKKEK